MESSMKLFLTTALLLVGSVFAVRSDQTACGSEKDQPAPNASTLPIFFFHGYGSPASAGANLAANLSTRSRPFVSFPECENECSQTDLRHQTSLAIAKIRSTTANDSRFDQGYVLVGHSQGGALVRAIVEEMDDHKVHTVVSLAGNLNGLFYGPRDVDFSGARAFREILSPVMVGPAVGNFSDYSDAEIRSGKLTLDWTKLQVSRSDLQDSRSSFQLFRNPVRSLWATYDTFFPVIDNIQSASTNATIAAEQARRKKNFLKLHAFHAFSSPSDGVLTPWETGILGHYNDVESINALETQFSSLSMLDMTKTHVYTEDTYGLRTLDRSGGVFIHKVEGVSHGCWLQDDTRVFTTEECKFKPVYEQNLHPILGSMSS